MEIKISYKKIEDKGFIIVKCGKYQLDVHENSDDWKTSGINQFLVNIGSYIPDNETFTVEFDQTIEDETYKHVCDLFNAFANEYNTNISL